MIHNIQFKQRIAIAVLLILNSVHSAFANPIEQPVVAFAVTYCHSAYLIRLFENGTIEYRGSYGVRTLGKREAKITPQAVKELLKKLTDAGAFTVTDDRMNSPSFPGEIKDEALYLRQGNKTALFFNGFFNNPNDSETNPLFPLLRNETLRAVNIKQWLDDAGLSSCKNSDGPTFYTIETNELKLINECSETKANCNRKPHKFEKRNTRAIRTLSAM
jgi:hypothetical protein